MSVICTDGPYVRTIISRIQDAKARGLTFVCCEEILGYVGLYANAPEELECMGLFSDQANVRYIAGRTGISVPGLGC